MEKPLKFGVLSSGKWKITCASGIIAVTAAMAVPATPSWGQENGDYQIVKATETVAWRLNRKTGEIAVCRLDGDTMICSSSTSAVTKGQQSYDAYKSDKENSEQTRQAHEMAVLDKVMNFFKSMITLMMDNSEK